MTRFALLAVCLLACAQLTYSQVLPGHPLHPDYVEPTEEPPALEDSAPEMVDEGAIGAEPAEELPPAVEEVPLEVAPAEEAPEEVEEASEEDEDAAEPETPESYSYAFFL